jgi:hypothetical protein
MCDQSIFGDESTFLKIKIASLLLSLSLSRIYTSIHTTMKLLIAIVRTLICIYKKHP